MLARAVSTVLLASGRAGRYLTPLLRDLHSGVVASCDPTAGTSTTMGAYKFYCLVLCKLGGSAGRNTLPARDVVGEEVDVVNIEYSEQTLR